MSIAIEGPPLARAPAAGIRVRLTAELGEMAPAQRRLASYLLEHGSSAPDLGITDLADEAGVSVGTISLLCRRLGLRGYQDLRLGLAREAVSAALHGAAAIPVRVDASDGDPMEAAIGRVFGAGGEALAETARQLDRPALATAVALIDGARRVEWVGVGSAGLVAAEGALKLRKLGVDSVSHFDGHQQAMSASLLGERDLLIAVSHSGRTTDVVESVRIAAEGGAHRIAITGVAASPLARLADVVLATVSYDTAFQVEPMASTLAQLAIVQLLFLAYLERAGEAAQERLARTQAALESRHVKGRLR
jgi:RpiR family transcriptional regulator, carbohydrate utilization regulator